MLRQAHSITVKVVQRQWHCLSARVAYGLCKRKGGIWQQRWCITRRMESYLKNCLYIAQISSTPQWYVIFTCYNTEMNYNWLITCGAKSMSWSTNCPHCINIWVKTSSFVNLSLDIRREDTSRALGRCVPRYTLERVHPETKLSVKKNSQEKYLI